MADKSAASKALLRACREMAAAEAREEWEDAEIVCSGRECWLGLRRVRKDTVNKGLFYCLFSAEGIGTDCERYTLNEDGRAIAADPHHIPRILRQNWKPEAGDGNG